VELPTFRLSTNLSIKWETSCRSRYWSLSVRLRAQPYSINLSKLLLYNQSVGSERVNLSGSVRSEQSASACVDVSCHQRYKQQARAFLAMVRKESEFRFSIRLPLERYTWGSSRESTPSVLVPISSVPSSSSSESWGRTCSSKYKGQSAASLFFLLG